MEKTMVNGVVTFSGHTNKDKYKKCELYKLSLKLDKNNLKNFVDTIKKAKVFDETKETFIPPFYKGESNDVCFKSKYPFKILDLNNNVLSLQDVLPGAKVTVEVTLKDGAIYPKSAKVWENGVEDNPFDDFENPFE